MTKKQPSGPTTKMTPDWLIYCETDRRADERITSHCHTKWREQWLRLRCSKPTSGQNVHETSKNIDILFGFLDTLTPNVLQICKAQHWGGDSGQSDEVLTLDVWSETVHPVMQTKTWGFVQTQELCGWKVADGILLFCSIGILIQSCCFPYWFISTIFNFNNSGICLL